MAALGMKCTVRKLDNACLTISFDGRELRLRIRIAMGLIKAAAWVLGTSTVIKDVSFGMKDETDG